MDEAFADYLKGMVALRKHVVDDMRRKLSDRQVLPRPSSPPERPASGARHRRARGRRPRGWGSPTQPGTAVRGSVRIPPAR